MTWRDMWCAPLRFSQIYMEPTIQFLLIMHIPRKACPLFFLLEMVMVRVYKYIRASYFRLASLMITSGITLMRDCSWSSPCIIKLKMKKSPKRTTKVKAPFHSFITISLVKCMVPLCDHVSYYHWNVYFLSKSIWFSLFSGRQKGMFSIC